MTEYKALQIGDTINLSGEIIAENNMLDTVTIEFTEIDSTVKNKITITRDELFNNRLTHLKRTIKNVDDMLEQGKEIR